MQEAAVKEGTLQELFSVTFQLALFQNPDQENPFQVVLNCPILICSVHQSAQAKWLYCLKWPTFSSYTCPLSCAC